MIIEKSFLLLRDELFRTVVEFEKDNNDYKTYFNEHSSLEEYKFHLNKLQLDFTQELRSNLIYYKSQGEIHMNLLITKRIFELIKARLQLTTETDYSGLNIRMISKNNSEISCVNTGSEEFLCVEKYLHCQYQASLEVISVINDCLENFSQPVKKKSSRRNKSEKAFWQDEMYVHYSDIMKLRNELYKPSTLLEKKSFVEKEKELLEEQYKRQGKDFYKNSASMQYEVRLESYREILLSTDEFKKQNPSPLIWNKSKTDLLELLNALHQAKAIGLKNGDEISRKDLIDNFVDFVNMEEIPDSDSRISKLQVRNTPNSFLLKLLEAVERILIEK